MGQVPTAAILIIGDEILSGRTQDTNSSYMARWLGEKGIELAEIRVVQDDKSRIIEAVQALKHSATYVLTTGGIGPTHDDITADAVAEAVGKPLIIDAEAFSALENHYGQADFTEARQRMARVPEGARLIANPLSIAPGFEINGIFVMAGVPKIMQAMINGLDGRIKGGIPVYTKTVTLHVGESSVAGSLDDLQKQHLQVSVGSYPFFDFDAKKGGTEIVVRSRDSEALDTCFHHLCAWLQAEGIPHEL